MLETPIATRSPGLQPEMVRRCRSLALQAHALADVLETLPCGSLPPLTQSRAVVELARLQSELETLADALGCMTNPQSAPQEESLYA